MRSQFIDRWTRSEHTVAVQVPERGGAGIAEIKAVETFAIGVDAGGSVHKLRHHRRRESHTFVKRQGAIIPAHDDVQGTVAVEVPERRGAPFADVHTVEYVSGASSFPEIWCFGRTHVLEEVQHACICTTVPTSDKVEVAVTVDIAERRGTRIADVNAIKWVRLVFPILKNRLRDGPHVLVETDLSIISTLDEIEVACGRHAVTIYRSKDTV